MPVARVLNADLESEVAELEKSNRIVSISESGPGAFVVIYEKKTLRVPPPPGQRETR